MLSPADAMKQRGNSVFDESSNYGYAPKSRLLYQGKRSKTNQKAPSSKAPSQVGPYIAETKSNTGNRLAKNKIERFNEEVASRGPKSEIRSQVSKPKS